MRMKLEDFRSGHVFLLDEKAEDATPWIVVSPSDELLTEVKASIRSAEEEHIRFAVNAITGELRGFDGEIEYQVYRIEGDVGPVIGKSFEDFIDFLRSALEDDEEDGEDR